MERKVNVKRSWKPLHHPAISLQSHMYTYQIMHLNSNVFSRWYFIWNSVFILFKNKNLKIISDKNMSFSCKRKILRYRASIICLGAKAIYKQKLGFGWAKMKLLILITLCCKVMITLNSQSRIHDSAPQKGRKPCFPGIHLLCSSHLLSSPLPSCQL